MASSPCSSRSKMPGQTGHTDRRCTRRLRMSRPVALCLEESGDISSVGFDYSEGFDASVCQLAKVGHRCHCVASSLIIKMVAFA